MKQGAPYSVKLLKRLSLASMQKMALRETAQIGRSERTVSQTSRRERMVAWVSVVAMERVRVDRFGTLFFSDTADEATILGYSLEFLYESN